MLMMVYCMALQLVELVQGSWVNHVITLCHMVTSWRLLTTDVG